jgi:hypothetical protein
MPYPTTLEQTRPWSAARDLRNRRQRVEVIDAIDWLVRTFVAPASDLLHGETPGLESLDLERIAGASVSGLVLEAVFPLRFPDLQPPDDAVLRESLLDIGVDLGSLTERADFFRCWAAISAMLSAQELLESLERVPPPAEEARDREAEVLSGLLDLPLPFELRDSIRRTLDIRSSEQSAEPLG